MSKTLLVGLTLLLFPTLSWAAIKNEIKIETNTGGNSVTSDSGSTIETGDSSTSVHISNSTDSNSNIRVESTQESQINIESSGTGKQEIEISIGAQKYELYHDGDTTYLKTTDPQGNVREEEWQDRQELNIQIDENSSINIQPTSTEFTMVHNGTRIYTPHNLTVTQDKTITIETDSGTQTLTILPNQIQPVINEQVSELTDTIKLASQNGELTYTVSGLTHKKLLGLFNVQIEKYLTISAETGQLTNQSIPSNLDRLQNFLSV